MIPLSQPTKTVKSTGNQGVFVVEGLYPGYGITVGNSLRRVLLSSLEGVAVTQAKVKGAQHEFSTIPGLQEDVLSVLLSLKQLRFKLHGVAPQTATLKAKGEKEVTGADFKLPATLELANPEISIAHLTEKSTELEIEIQVEKGIGYVPAEDRKKEKQEIGTIVLDSIFTPVQKVSSKVENMRVGDRTDFNRLTIEIETDGTISPEEAFFQATEILLKQFEVVMAGVRDKAQAKQAAGAEVPKKAAKTTKTRKKK